MLVAFAGPVFNSLYLLKSGPLPVWQMSTLGSLASGIHQVTSLVLLSYVLARRGRKFRDLKLEWSIRDLWRGAIVAGASMGAYTTAAMAIRSVHFMIFRTPITAHSAREFFGRPTLAAVIPFVVLNPFFEEMIVRAYLMTEVIELTGSTALAVALSCVLQGVYHLYYGWWIATALTFKFLVYSIYFAQARRALPMVFAHGLSDLYGFIGLLLH